MPDALRVRKYWQAAARPPAVKAVTGDLSSAVTRGPHVTTSLCLPKSLYPGPFCLSRHRLPPALWSKGRAEVSKSPWSS